MDIVNNYTYFVEIFGIEGVDRYYKKTEDKIKICKDNSLKLIDLYSNDILDNNFDELYDLIISKINKFKEVRLLLNKVYKSL